MSESSTYEATKARQSTQGQPDKIHWDGGAAFRDQPYRQLHHQRGLIGLFRVRLLEASDLKRSYWSPLALGPVRHLGLSKAHGAVSAFCTFSLGYDDIDEKQEDPRSKHVTEHRQGDWDKKPAAKPMASQKRKQSKVVSPVVQTDNNPVWENFQFEFPLLKGALPKDGMRIQLQVRVEEDGTAVENLIPGLPSSGDSRLLGVGKLDLTELCLGETVDGQVLPGVRDSWVSISLAGQEPPQESDNLPYSKADPLAPPVKPVASSGPPPVTGVVRVLVSYQPLGLEPQPKDIVALEAFARKDPSASTCRPLLQPLMPLTVVERRGPYVLCEYSLLDARRRKACIRLHRNAVFVIERQNLIDAAHNLALLPIDVMISTPVGQATVHTLGPVVAAGREILMPALLSFKLIWMAGRTTTLAGLSGVQALGGTLWHEGSSSLTASHRSNSGVLHAPPPVRRDGGAASAQYVQL
jgi:hypothetical protein